MYKEQVVANVKKDSSPQKAILFYYELLFLLKHCWKQLRIDVQTAPEPILVTALVSSTFEGFSAIVNKLSRVTYLQPYKRLYL